MNTLNVKVQGYDETTGSLLVSFSTDASAKSVDDYQVLAFQPQNYAASNVDVLMTTIANSGLSVAITQDRQEQIANSPSTIAEYKALVGQTFTYNANSLAVNSSITGNLTDIVEN